MQIMIYMVNVTADILDTTVSEGTAAGGGVVASSETSPAAKLMPPEPSPVRGAARMRARSSSVRGVSLLLSLAPYPSVGGSVEEVAGCSDDALRRVVGASAEDEEEDEEDEEVDVVDVVDDVVVVEVVDVDDVVEVVGSAFGAELSTGSF